MESAGPNPTTPLSHQDVRKVALLSRLHLSDAQIEKFRPQLAAILGHVEMLRALDLTGVQPMAHPSDAVNRWDDDEISPERALSTEDLMRLAPEAAPPFVKVPKVIGEGSGA